MHYLHSLHILEGKHLVIGLGHQGIIPRCCQDVLKKFFLHC